MSTFKPGDVAIWGDCKVTVLPMTEGGLVPDGWVPVWDDSAERGRMAPMSQLRKFPSSPSPTWEMTACERENREDMNRLLAQGWEPFSVTVSPDRMCENMHDGTTNYFRHVVWLKRLKTA